MSTPQAAASNYETQQRIGAVAAVTASRLWARMGDDFDTGWASIERPLVSVVTEAQTVAAATSTRYLERVIYETGDVDLPAGEIRPEAFAGTAGDGRALSGLMFGAVTSAKNAIAAGATVAEALAVGGRQLRMTTLTAVADAQREATSAGIAVRPAIGGWVRMLNLPSCSRCIILAGKWFRWNEGFQRHPRCDCRHIPSSESIAGDMTTDPYAAFESMSREEQDAKFGRSEARAIRDGGDIFRVVNVQSRGLGTASAARRYGTPSRLTVDDIYRQAGTRTNAIRMLTQEGYITGPQVAGGNIVGTREGFGALGRGGTRVAASAAVRTARTTGVRDPLNRYTMTAAERRLYDAHSMVETVRAGRNPWVRGRPVSDQDRALAATLLQRQLDGLATQPRQVSELARLLDLI